MRPAPACNQENGDLLVAGNVTAPAQSLGSFCSDCLNLLRCKIIRRPSACIKSDESFSQAKGLKKL